MVDMVSLVSIGTLYLLPAWKVVPEASKIIPPIRSLSAGSVRFLLPCLSLSLSRSRSPWLLALA